MEGATPRQLSREGGGKADKEGKKIQGGVIMKLIRK